MSDPIPPKERELSTPAVSPPDPRSPRRPTLKTPRKSSAMKALGSYITEAQTLMNRDFPFHGTRMAFMHVIGRLRKIREGIRKATSIADIKKQEIRAKAIAKDVRDMAFWSPDNFRNFYKIHVIRPPETLGEPKRRKARARPLQLGADPRMRSSAKASVEVRVHTTHDSLAFDPDEWQNDPVVTVDATLQGPQLAANTAMAGSLGNEAFGK